MKVCKCSLSILLILSAVLLYLPFTVHAHPFTDVNLNGDYADAVNYLYDNNIMQGVASTTFEPNTNVNRGMFVTFLYRFAGEPQEFADIDFIDVPEGRYFTNAVRWGCILELLSEPPQQHFHQGQVFKSSRLSPSSTVLHSTEGILFPLLVCRPDPDLKMCLTMPKPPCAGPKTMELWITASGQLYRSTAQKPQRAFIATQ